MIGGLVREAHLLVVYTGQFPTGPQSKLLLPQLTPCILTLNRFTDAQVSTDHSGKQRHGWKGKARSHLKKLFQAEDSMLCRASRKYNRLAHPTSIAAVLLGDLRRR